MMRYIHGSADSTDLDVVYVFEEMPSREECQAFCRDTDGENRNIIVIRGGVVSQCFKGLRDEVNNALLATYPLHDQEYPLLIERSVERDVPLKDIVATRKILSSLTRTRLRPQIKEALHGSWNVRINLLRNLPLSGLDLHAAGESGADILKRMAFQLGQGIGLHAGVGLYTKSDIAGFYPALRPFLYREDGDLEEMQAALAQYADILAQMQAELLSEDEICVPSTGAVYDIRREVRMN